MFRFSDATNPLAVAAFGVAVLGCSAGDPYNDWNDKKDQRGGWSYEK